MILSDRENKLALYRDHIRITHRPADGAFSSTAVDLTLHEEICQLILEEVHGTPDKGYQGAFAVQAPEPAGPAVVSPAPKPRKRRRS
jgi:hypothetical protein